MNIETVLEYIKKNSNSPLTFGRNRYTNDVAPEITGDGTVRDLIIDILLTSSNCPSMKGSRIDTTPGRRRSAGDIWRHALSIRPGITLFEIMNELYQMVRHSPNGFSSSQLTKTGGGLASFICPDISKRVFRFNRNSGGDSEYAENKDEFGLTMLDWKDVNPGGVR